MADWIPEWIDLGYRAIIERGAPRIVNTPWIEDFRRYPLKDYFLEIRGHRCSIRRGPTLHWCGYLSIPEEHPYFHREDIHELIRMHGGITYAGIGGCIGFDCAHHTDVVPMDEYLMALLPPGRRERRPRHYWSYEDVYAELENIIEQIQNNI